MKSVLLTTALTALLALGFTAPAMAAEHDHSAMHSASTAQPMADGVVKKVDKAAGKVTISHGPLPDGMPAMTMAFKVKQAAWLDQLKAGQKIRFALEDVNGASTIVRFEPVK